MNNSNGSYFLVNLKDGSKAIFSRNKLLRFIGINSTEDIGKELLIKLNDSFGYYIGPKSYTYEEPIDCIVKGTYARLVDSGKSKVILASAEDFIELPYIFLRRGVNIIYGNKEELEKVYLHPAEVVKVNDVYYVNSEFDDDFQKTLLNNFYNKNRIREK